jgi:GxxExxY protein
VNPTETPPVLEKDALTQAVIGAALEVHRILGPGLLESIYEEALCYELRLRGLRFTRQKPVDVLYKGVVIKGQRIDLVVEDELIIEIKSVSSMPEVVLAQTLSYLRTTGIRRALIINFGERLLKDGIRRVSL